jgi:hypothetical protein
VNLLDRIQKTQLKSVKRSIISSEVNQRKASEAGRTLHILQENGLPEEAKDNIDAYLLRHFYDIKLADYHHTTAKTQWRALKKQGLTLWNRVNKARITAGVDHETFIAAQFTYFHDTFKAAPKIQQLATDAAILRATTVTARKVTSAVVEVKPDVPELFRTCERMMLSMMRQHTLSRVEVYKNLVHTRLIAFPDVFLEADPAWKASLNV